MDNGGDRKSVLYHNTDSPSPQQGTSTDYLARRIERDHPEIAERVRAGEYQSIHRAAIDAGIVKERISISTDPPRILGVDKYL